MKRILCAPILFFLILQMYGRTDDLSGIDTISVRLIKPKSHYSFNHSSTNPFIQVNDSIYRLVITKREPWFPNGNYKLALTISDSANNTFRLDDNIMFDINHKNSDDSAPTLISAWFNKDTLFNDDEIELKIACSDTTSGLRYMSFAVRKAGKNTSGGGDIYYYDKFFNFEKSEVESTFKIKPKEFGPRGMWEIGYFQILDRAYNTLSKAVVDSFYYEPKFYDDEYPAYESLTFTPDQINAGDTLTATLKVYDKHSGVDASSIRIDGIFGTDFNFTKVDNATFKAYIPINKYHKHGRKSFSVDNICDNAGNCRFAKALAVFLQSQRPFTRRTRC